MRGVAIHLNNTGRFLICLRMAALPGCELTERWSTSLQVQSQTELGPRGRVSLVPPAWAATSQRQQLPFPGTTWLGSSQESQAKGSQTPRVPLPAPSPSVQGDLWPSCTSPQRAPWGGSVGSQGLCSPSSGDVLEMGAAGWLWAAGAQAQGHVGRSEPGSGRRLIWVQSWLRKLKVRAQQNTDCHRWLPSAGAGASLPKGAEIAPWREVRCTPAVAPAGWRHSVSLAQMLAGGLGLPSAPSTSSLRGPRRHRGQLAGGGLRACGRASRSP